MTIQLIKTAEATFYNLPEPLTYVETNTSYLPQLVVNPTLPFVIFNGMGYNSQVIPDILLVVIGNNYQFYPPASDTQTNGAGLTITAYHNPVLFFSECVIIGLNYFNRNSIEPPGTIYYVSSTIGVANLRNNIFNWTENVFPPDSFFAGWSDIYVDYEDQVLYLLGVNYNAFIMMLFSIPFSELSTLLNNLQFPQNFNEASLMIPNINYSDFINRGVNPPTLQQQLNCTPIMIYYNKTFYMFFTYSASFQEMGFYLWYFTLDEVTWTTGMPSFTSTTIQGNTYNYVPSNTQTVGSLLTILEINSYSFAMYADFNYYIDNGSIYPEFLVVIAYYEAPGTPIGTIAIYSINPDTLSITQLDVINNPNLPATYFGPAYFSGGLIIMPVDYETTPGDASTDILYYLFIYDRNTGETAIFPPPQNAIAVGASDGGYVVYAVGVGTPTTLNNTTYYYNVTIIVYQVVSDSEPIITNGQYSTDNTITGTVEDLVNNTPVAGATVALFQLISQGGYQFTGEIIATTTTDANGNFSFQVSQPGYYAIRAFT